MVAGRWRAPLPLMIDNRTSSPRKEHGAPAKRRGKDENGENGGDLFHKFRPLLWTHHAAQPAIVRHGFLEHFGFKAVAPQPCFP